MVWFGRHPLAYAIYVPAALVGLLAPHVGQFAAGSGGTQTAAKAAVPIAAVAINGRANGHAAVPILPPSRLAVALLGWVSCWKIFYSNRLLGVRVHYIHTKGVA